MKKGTILVAMLVALLVSGCNSPSAAKQKATANSISKKRAKPKVNPRIGKIISSKKHDYNMPYQMVNKKMKFYRSLKEFGTTGGEYSDYSTEEGHIFGVDKIYQTSKGGTIYHLRLYQSGGFEGLAAKDDSDFDYYDNAGYVKASDMQQKSPIRSERTLPKIPYYIAKPYTRAAWNRPYNTAYYTYVVHVLDKFVNKQLYATKEIIKTNGERYVYLESKTRKLGWVYASGQDLVQGNYVDPGKKLLKPKRLEKLECQIQSMNTLPKNRSQSSSVLVQQRLYTVKDKKQHLLRLLVIGMDNRMIRIDLNHDKPVKLVVYSYLQKPWKTITNQQKLMSHYRAAHLASDVPWATTYFYPKSKLRLATVTIDSTEAVSTIKISRTGRAQFKTDLGKHILGYSAKRLQ
ncbi:hypothetical protein [Lactiplantibacillus mudanjiangensis]|uniref:Lipoprotein n=1 Tax=Lactiplantibacillus mudanjiangensis TaxID=1296538 RepID=A0A660E7I7_9LACO|nr:hypothetical protein [Lactiplantibacillus mudanjiangensis]VDG26064.1 hypothetical protein [Lactobacillus brevis] [Lactiplantibacillus mudanjiangensis]VDG29098.1 hypothetical protein [Lactobacillus brevis] [Lactiplantibacillus mudanjiangensis]